MKIALIIPAHNEAKRIATVIQSLAKYKEDIIIIDDGSIDATAAIVRRHGVIILTHAVNLGKGAALTTGIEHAIMLGYDAIIMMDADGQHDPADIPKFIQALKKSDLIFGYREINSSNSLIRYIGNKFDEWLINALYKGRIKDPICGYRAMKTNLYNTLRWSSVGYEVETEMVINAIKRRIPFVQVPVATKYLDYYKGVSILNAWKIMFDVVKWRITP
jgi:glycosyltransferase involved in cell wall biosynthesis